MGYFKLVNRFAKRLSRKGLNEFLEQQAALLEPQSRVLNVGAGGEVQAWLDQIAKRRGFAVTNSDVDPARNPDVVDDITRSSLPDASYDAIVMMEVLEHVQQPFDAASEILRLLKPGGRLILSAPYFFPLHDRPYDYFRFTKYGLSHLFRDLESLSVRERNSWPEAVLVVIARLYVEKGRVVRLVAPFVVGLCVVLYPIATVLGKILRSDHFTIGYTVSGKKPLDKSDPTAATR